MVEVSEQTSFLKGSRNQVLLIKHLKLLEQKHVKFFLDMSS